MICHILSYVQHWKQAGLETKKYENRIRKDRAIIDWTRNLTSEWPLCGHVSKIPQNSTCPNGHQIHRKALYLEMLKIILLDILGQVVDLDCGIRSQDEKTITIILRTLFCFHNVSYYTTNSLTYIYETQERRRFHHISQTWSPPASLPQEAGYTEVGLPAQLEICLENYNDLFTIYWFASPTESLSHRREALRAMLPLLLSPFPPPLQHSVKMAPWVFLVFSLRQ